MAEKPQIIDINLNYNIVLISHEDTSKDITKRSGDKITAI